MQYEFPRCHTLIQPLLKAHRSKLEGRRLREIPQTMRIDMRFIDPGIVIDVIYDRCRPATSDHHVFLFP